MTYHPNDSDDDGTVEADVNNSSVSTEEASIGQVAARAGPTSDQGIAGDGSYVQVNLDSSTINDTTVLSVDTANNVITVQADGTYFLQCVLNWRIDANWTEGDEQRCAIHSGGTRTAIHENEAMSSAGSNRRTISVAVVEELSSNDDIYMEARQSSGSTIDVTGATSRTYLQVVRIG